jgi:hypothetical protein
MCCCCVLACSSLKLSSTTASKVSRVSICLADCSEHESRLTCDVLAAPEWSTRNLHAAKPINEKQDQSLIQETLLDECCVQFYGIATNKTSLLSLLSLVNSSPAPTPVHCQTCKEIIACCPE